MLGHAVCVVHRAGPQISEEMEEPVARGALRQTANLLRHDARGARGGARELRRCQRRTSAPRSARTRSRWPGTRSGSRRSRCTETRARRRPVPSCPAEIVGSARARQGAGRHAAGARSAQRQRRRPPDGARRRPRREAHPLPHRPPRRLPRRPAAALDPRRGPPVLVGRELLRRRDRAELLAASRAARSGLQAEIGATAVVALNVQLANALPPPIESGDEGQRLSRATARGSATRTAAAISTSLPASPSSRSATATPRRSPLHTRAALTSPAREQPYATSPQPSSAALLSAAPAPRRQFFCSSGAEANEAAVSRKLPPGVLALEGSFHGRTLAALAVTGQPAKRAAFEPFGGALRGTERRRLPLRCRRRRRRPPCLLEPVLGEGGVIPLFPSSSQPSVAR